MQRNKKIDDYICSLPEWQREVCEEVRRLVHQAEPRIREEIKFTNRPYFTYMGNVCALLATKDHVNVFIYDPIAPDPNKIINQGNDNATARSIQIYKDQFPDKLSFIELMKRVVEDNQKGGWRRLMKSQQ